MFTTNSQGPGSYIMLIGRFQQGDATKGQDAESGARSSLGVGNLVSREALAFLNL